MTSGDTVTVLRAARELLSDEARWCQGSWAYDTDGDEVDPELKYAVRWSVLGALARTSGTYASAQIYIERVLASRGVNVPAGVWGDYPDTTHADVMAVLDEAIERAQARLAELKAGTLRPKCEDCRFCIDESPNENALCAQPDILRQREKEKYSHPLSGAIFERMENELCGPEGKLFEAAK